MPPTEPAPGPQVGRVVELDAETIRRIEAPPYLQAMVRHGPRLYIDNAHVRMTALCIDGLVLPLVIAEPRKDKAHNCSPRAHYGSYTLEEMIKRNARVPPWVFKGTVGVYSACLGLLGIDRVVYVDHWLFGTNPQAPLCEHQIDPLTDYLRERYPAHAIVFPGVNAHFDRPRYAGLLGRGFVMVKSRKVYVLDTQASGFPQRRNAKEDLALLRKTPYDVTDGEGVTDPEVSRLAELYRVLYLDRHSYLNAQLNERFFELTLKDQSLEYRIWRKDGRVDGFVSFLVQHGVLSGQFIGYDPEVPRKIGLYRQLIALLMREARERNLLLNLSGGAGEFKSLRGAAPVVEHDAVYVRHLPLYRHLPWRLVRLQGQAW